jgi:hypothetical protein
MFLDHDLKPTDPKLPIRSKYAPKRNRSHPDDPAYARTVTQIRVTKVIERLQSYALGQNDAKGCPIIMTAGQVKAARVFLGKYLPNLKPVKVSG